MHAASRRNPRESTYDERVFGYEVSRVQAVCEPPSTCGNPVYLHASHAWRYRQTKALPTLLSFHVLSWPISRSPAWMVASDDERKSQELKFCASKEALNQAWFATDPFHRGAQLMPQMWDVETAHIAELDPLQLSPEALTRVQLRGIRG
jgi:hypothetical protein